MANFRGMIISLAVLGAATLCYSASPCELQFKDCGSKAGSLSSAMYNGTCDKGKAVLVQGTEVSIAFGFQTKNSESELTSKVKGKIGELPFVPFPLKNSDACKDSGLTCPVAANTNVVYKPVLNILTSFPKVNVIVKWELINKNNEDVFCALIPASIVAK